MANITSKAPLLKPLRTEGGTFITFSSAVNDMSLMIGDTDIRSIASKFALIKLPNWADVVDTQHMYEDPVNIGTPLVTDPNTIFPKLLQNYVENLIQYSEQSRTDIDYDTIAEVAFWKLLRRIGALNLVTDGTDTIDGDTVDVYKEEDDSETYSKIIKYIGDINALNHVKKNGREYIEVFAHIPSEAGFLAKTRFIPKKVSHTNALIPDGGGNVKTIGLEDFDNNQNLAIYDNIDNTYSLDNDLNLSVIDFDYHISNDVYKNQGNFEFNAVLLFADTFDKNDSNTKRTNLFGILLLEPFNSVGGYHIPTLKKLQSNNNQAGNSHVFRFNINLSTQTDQVTSDIVINDYSTVSMHMYTDALKKVTETAILFEDFSTQITEMNAKIVSLQQILSNYNTLNTLISQVQTNTNNISKIAASQAKQGDVRISNEDLFLLFQKTIDALNNNNNNINVTNTIIMTHKALLPTLVDKDNLILEDYTGLQYQWNELTQEWDLI